MSAKEARVWIEREWKEERRQHKSIDITRDARKEKISHLWEEKAKILRVNEKKEDSDLLSKFNFYIIYESEISSAVLTAKKAKESRMFERNGSERARKKRQL